MDVKAEVNVQPAEIPTQAFDFDGKIRVPELTENPDLAQGQLGAGADVEGAVRFLAEALQVDGIGSVAHCDIGVDDGQRDPQFAADSEIIIVHLLLDVRREGFSKEVVIGAIELPFHGQAEELAPGLSSV